MSDNAAVAEKPRVNTYVPGPMDSPIPLARRQRFSKKAIQKALHASHGLISNAAKRLRCQPKTVREYLKRYPELQEELNDIRDAYVDLAESSLLTQIQEKNTTATIFLLKCLGKKRGWIDNPTVQLHAHVEAGSGSWVDIMKRVADEAGGVLEATPEEIARVIDITPPALLKSSASACTSQDEPVETEVRQDTEDGSSGE